jgi:glycerol-3-phosphate acyltransferase PlsY
MTFGLFLAIAYLLGSIPFALLLARRWSGVDVRKVGSGNVGATNVLRHGHPAVALAVVLLDIGKGVAAIWFARRAGLPIAALAIVGIAAIAGHVYPVWLHFHGGKGVATTCGVFGLLAPRATLAAIIVFAVLVWVSRYVSLASLAGAVTLVAGTYGFGDPSAVILAAVAAGLLIFIRHRDNVGRLLDGTEHRIGSGSGSGV